MEMVRVLKMRGYNEHLIEKSIKLSSALKVRNLKLEGSEEIPLKLLVGLSCLLLDLLSLKFIMVTTAMNNMFIGRLVLKSVYKGGPWKDTLSTKPQI